MRNPTRRNRNIGTRKQGHGQDNRLKIPESWPDDRIFWEVLDNPVVIVRLIHGCEMTFLVEAARSDCVYPCTVDDIVGVLEWLPHADLQGICLIILRQPTRKQTVLSPVWGRYLYYATPDPHCGPAIVIEAQDLSAKWTWPKSLDPDDQRELRRLEEDGHRIVRGRRGYTIERSLASIRNTVLFRTLVHEVGHNVDYIQSVLSHFATSEDEREDARRDREFAGKPSKDREAFAHRYADEKATQLRQGGVVPFPCIADMKAMRAEGLDPAWFGL